MNQLDIVLIIMLAAGFILGYAKGLIKQLTFGAGVAIGLLQAILFHSPVADKITAATGWNNLLCISLAFIGIIVLTTLLFKLAGLILSGLLKLVHLKFIDRILGALLGTFIAMLLLMGAVKATEQFAADAPLLGKTSQSASLLYKKASNATLLFIKEVKEEIDEEKQ